MSIQNIVAEVSAEHGLTPADIIGRSRVKKIVLARQEVMWRARQLKRCDGGYKYSLPRIGRNLHRDHTTVLHGVRAHEGRGEHTANIPHHLTPAIACDLQSPANQVRLDA